MSDPQIPPPEEIVLFEKDPATKIATITFNRPEHLNSATIGARLRYADLLHRANVDDDVKVLVIRGAGEDFGSGADLPELAALQASSNDAALSAELGIDEGEVTFPPTGSYRANATLTQWYADGRSGCRTLADFKKISIVEVKGYCYGWQFYLAGAEQGFRRGSLVNFHIQSVKRPGVLPMTRDYIADEFARLSTLEKAPEWHLQQAAE